MVEPKIHTLANGATVLITSPGHGFRFSDGTSCESQYKEICDRLTLRREEKHIKTVRGMKVNRTEMIISAEQLHLLTELCELADIVLVPLPVLLALREQGVRHRFPNAFAMNRTKETQREAPDKGVVDINNWSY